MSSPVDRSRPQGVAIGPTLVDKLSWRSTFVYSAARKLDMLDSVNVQAAMTYDTPPPSGQKGNVPLIVSPDDVPRPLNVLGAQPVAIGPRYVDKLSSRTTFVFDSATGKLEQVLDGNSDPVAMNDKFVMSELDGSEVDSPLIVCPDQVPKQSS
jgi:hypothetical protein